MIKFITQEQDANWLLPVHGIEIVEDMDGSWVICDEDRTEDFGAPMPKNWIIA